MMKLLRSAWLWLVDGLVEAAFWTIDRLRRGAPLRLVVGADETLVLDPDGERLGRLVETDGATVFEPPILARRLSASRVDLVMPDAWMQRRDLDPVALASRPYLDAFVRHQIERVTPWRVADTYYRVLDRPLPEDRGRLAVMVAVVPRRLVSGPVAALARLDPPVVRLRCVSDPAGDFAISLDTSRPKRAARLRTGIGRGLVGAALAVVGLTVAFEWQAAGLREEIAEQDRVLAQRATVLSRMRLGSDRGGEAAVKLRNLRAARSPAVAVIDALAQALPDAAHLTALVIDGDHVSVSGITSDPASLVPALETSGAFAEVAFGSAMTSAEDNAGDRFTLGMRALPQRSDHAGSPPPASRNGRTP